MRKSAIKISVLFCLIICLLIVACCKNSTDNNSDKPTTSGYEDYIIYGSNIDSYIETSTGSYYIDESYVYYTDRGNTKYVKLCGKPDCKHNSEDCNAYIGPSSIGAYKDHIYWWRFDFTERGLSLYRMDLDGSNHEKVKNIFSSMSFSYSGKFHRGYLYYTLGESNQDTSNHDKILYKIPLDNESSATELVDSKDIGPISWFTPVNDDVFISVYENPTHPLYFYSCKTQKTTKAVDDLVCSGITNLENKALIFREGEGIYELPYSDFKETLEKPVDFPGDFGIFSVDNYIYLVQYAGSKTSEEDMMLYVYDPSYDFVDKAVIDIPITNKRGCNLFAVNSDYLLFITANPPLAPEYYIDKSQIGTGNMELIKIE